MSKDKSLQFVDKILDNVHGFIPYTEYEKKIIDCVLFKRLQSIKQLSTVDWVFPGSEHTRYIHSLGVMHIADQIAMAIRLTDDERKIVRMAGLLHDIGHYPLSHVCEYPYEREIEVIEGQFNCSRINERIKSDIDNFTDKEIIYMKKSSGYHHEKVGADIVLNDKEINTIVKQACGPKAPEIIADMIIGKVDSATTDPLYVQILHSELDADGIDYLMRDAVFSGTSFGAFEVNQLIRCMEIGLYNAKRILCINPKGIAAADQYLINKFFSYSQVVFNKHVVISEFMTEQVIDWMKQNDKSFPSRKDLSEWIKGPVIKPEYYDFTDIKYWTSVKNLQENSLSEIEPLFIQRFCEYLLRRQEPSCTDEVKCVSTDVDTIKTILQSSNIYKNLGSNEKDINILLTRRMSKQIKSEKFEELLKNAKIDTSDGIQTLSEDDKKMKRERRLMDCICVNDSGIIRPLCDDPRSMMQEIHNMYLAVLRSYDGSI